MAAGRVRTAEQKRHKPTLRERLRDADGFKPVGSYLYMLWELLSRQASTWVFPALVFIIPIVAGVLSGFSSGLSIVFGAVMAVAFILLVVYVVIKAVNVFKDPESQGYEILVVSKPIERWQIVAGKLIAMLTVAVGSSLVVFLGTCLGTVMNEALTDPTTASQVNSLTFISQTKLDVGFAGLMLGAALAFSLLFGSITALICSRCSKKLATALPILIFAALYVASIASNVASLAVSGSDAMNFVSSVDSQYPSSSFGAGMFKYVRDGDNLRVDYQPPTQVQGSAPATGGDGQAAAQTPDWAQANADVAKLRQLWSDNQNSGAWYAAVKWIDVAVPLLESGQIFSGGGSVMTIINPDLAVVSDPNFSYVATFDSAWDGLKGHTSPDDSGCYPVAVISRGAERSPSWAVILVWCLISLGFVALSGRLYMRRDFR